MKPVDQTSFYDPDAPPDKQLGDGELLAAAREMAAAGELTSQVRRHVQCHCVGGSGKGGSGNRCGMDATPDSPFCDSCENRHVPTDVDVSAVPPGTPNERHYDEAWAATEARRARRAAALERVDEAQGWRG